MLDSMTKLPEKPGMLIAAFDPGETTGFAAAYVDMHAPRPEFQVLKDGDITSLDDFNKICVPVYNSHEGVITVVESFYLFPHKAQGQIGSTMPSSEWIGVIKYFCYVFDQLEPIMQTPHQKSRIGDDMLTHYFPGHDLKILSPHTKDALRHIVFWALDEKYG